VSTAVSEVRLSTEPRTEFGKGAARRVRRAGKVPAVVYGHGEKPVHVSLPGHDTMIALRRDPNVLLTLEIEGRDQLALPRAVVRDPIKGFLEHVDLLVVRRGEKVTVELPVTIEGDTAPGALPEVQMQTLSVESDATRIPESVIVSVEGLDIGAQVTAGDVRLPEGVTLAGDPSQLVLSVQGSSTAAELEVADAEAAEVAEGVSGEGEPSGEGDVVPDSESDAGGPGGAPSDSAA